MKKAIIYLIEFLAIQLIRRLCSTFGMETLWRQH